MSDAYIIEVGSQAAGIAVRDTDGFRFFASSHRFNPMEGQLFRNAREAERAAFRFLSGRAPQAKADAGRESADAPWARRMRAR
jgi:hypothetical protein